VAGEPLRIADPRLPAADETPDPDLTAAEAPSWYDALRAEFTAPVVDDDIVLAIPGRAGWSARYATTIRDDDLSRWTKIAARKDRRDDDPVRGQFTERLLFCALVLAERCQALLREGESVDLDGTTARFSEREFQKVLGTTRSVVAVRMVYGRDSDVLSAAGRLLDAAGYAGELSDDDDREDPTTA
jgi:hypothetical protein